jgi:putative nucleotidyltransferase with HDIG domain
MWKELVGRHGTRVVAPLSIWGAFLIIAAVHVGVGRGTHELHVLHVAFGAAYLLPIVSAACWLGARSALLLSAASSIAYVLHAFTAWRGEPMENANQLALAAVLFVVGATTSWLVTAREREHEARIGSERRLQRDAIVQAVASLSGALRERDDGTALHSARVSEIASRLAVALGLPPERVDLLKLAALVHDVGKIGVRDDVLLKPGDLTPSERKRIERHPTIAAEILRPIRGAEEIAEIVLCHHECPDGSGYPRGLVGAEIPPEARLLRVADVFAALVEPRPYKPPMAETKALARMRELEGKLDPLTLAALERLIKGEAAGG